MPRPAASMAAATTPARRRGGARQGAKVQTPARSRTPKRGGQRGGSGYAQASPASALAPRRGGGMQMDDASAAAAALAGEVIVSRGQAILERYREALQRSAAEEQKRARGAETEASRLADALKQLIAAEKRRAAGLKALKVEVEQLAAAAKFAQKQLPPPTPTATLATPGGPRSRGAPPLQLPAPASRRPRRTLRE
eukprot:TRINITY_DN78637_c0_g1_i1.p1 TRINITY_DN78637_c0_g1~~TRINITY_DN78637_c0_g1_i1.p1  ORF type:complete len:196 (+),score=47.96 TRINITY_DN78637_c0_g1_i1:84-671(+)